MPICQDNSGFRTACFLQRYFLASWQFSVVLHKILDAPRKQDIGRLTLVVYPFGIVIKIGRVVANGILAPISVLLQP